MRRSAAIGLVALTPLLGAARCSPRQIAAVVAYYEATHPAEVAAPAAPEVAPSGVEVVSVCPTFVATITGGTPGATVFVGIYSEPQMGWHLDAAGSLTVSRDTSFYIGYGVIDYSIAFPAVDVLHAPTVTGSAIC